MLAEGTFEHELHVRTVLMLSKRLGTHVLAGCIVERLVDRCLLSFGEAMHERIKLPERHRLRKHRWDVGRLWAPSRSSIDMPNAGE